MTAAQYDLRPGSRVSHPRYGTGTLLSTRYCGGIYTAGVEWDKAPEWIRYTGGKGRRCGCDLSDLTPVQ